MTPAARNLKLSRQLRETRMACVAALESCLKETDYKRWVADVNAKIANINQAIRASKP